MKNKPVDLQQEFLSALYELGQTPCTLDQIRRIRPNLPEIEVVQCRVPSAYYTINYYDRPRTYCITPEGTDRYLNDIRDQKRYETGLRLTILSIFFAAAAFVVSVVALFI